MRVMSVALIAVTDVICSHLDWQKAVYPAHDLTWLSSPFGQQFDCLSTTLIHSRLLFNNYDD